MSSEEKKSAEAEEPEFNQEPESEPDKEPNNKGDAIDEKNASDETLKGIQSTLSKIQGGIESLSKMSETVESLQKKIQEVEKEVENSKPFKELHSPRPEGYFNYDRINNKYVNDATNDERKKAFEIINRLNSSIIM